MTARLPWTAKDVVKLAPRDWLTFNCTILFKKLIGSWRYPIPTSGDLETMTRKDVIYWIYKARYPVTKAVKDSGLERFFEKQALHTWALPKGFTPMSALSISAVGDLMDHPFLANSGDHLYKEVADTIFSTDISMANLECVVFPEGSGAFEIKPTEAPPLYYKQRNFDVAKGMGGRKYTFMATANNHSLDCGEQGVASTAQALRQEGIAFHGINQSVENTRHASVIVKKDFRIGVISHTFGLNAKKPPQDKPWIVNRTHLNGKVNEIDFTAIEQQIKDARYKNVDIVLCQLHWGLEHEYYPRPEQIEVAHHLAELGVDVLIGHHPHLIQPVEFYRTQRDPDRVVPIYYSLGNLLTPFSHPAFRRSGIAQIRLSKGLDRFGKPQTYVESADMTEALQVIDEKAKTIRLTLLDSKT